MKKTLRMLEKSSHKGLDSLKILVEDIRQKQKLAKRRDRNCYRKVY